MTPEENQAIYEKILQALPEGLVDYFKNKIIQEHQESQTDPFDKTPDEEKQAIIDEALNIMPCLK